MKELDFNYICSPHNNFKKTLGVVSDLLWGEENRMISPLVTILIITNSRPTLFKEALNSVICQEHVEYPWEIVVMDNNPQESRVLSIVKELDNGRIRYYRNQRNIGHEGNINRGVELAKGTWVAILHDDDLLVPNYLTLIYKYVKACENWKKPLAYIRARHLLCTEDSKCINSKSTTIEPKVFIRPELWCESLLRGTGTTFVNSCGSLVNRNYFIKIGGYNQELYPIGDATLGFIFMNKGYSVYASERILGYYRQGSNESIKMSTVISFIEADYQLREYLYSQNRLSLLWGNVFRKTQFCESVDAKNKILLKYTNAKPNMLVKATEVEHICKYEKNYFLECLLIVIRVVFNIIYRPFHVFDKIINR